MPNKKPVPGYIWMLAGLAIGLFAAFLVYLDKQPTEQVSFTDAVKQELKKAREQQKQEAASQQHMSNTTSDNSNSGSSNNKPRFEFYTILSELEVFVPEPEAEAKTKTTAQKPLNIPTSGSKKISVTGRLI